jgi:hypothetical protein
MYSFIFAIVWVLNVPPKTHVLKAYSLGWCYWEVGLSERSLGHWKHSLEGDGGTLVSFSSSLLLPCLLIEGILLGNVLHNVLPC